MRISDWSSDVCSSDLSEAVWHGFAVNPRWPSRETQRFLCGHLMAILKGDANWTLDESEKQHLVQKMVWLSEPLSDDGQLISFRQVRDVLDRKSTRLNYSH